MTCNLLFEGQEGRKRLGRRAKDNRRSQPVTIPPVLKCGEFQLLG
jgi:hypothetical protein